MYVATITVLIIATLSASVLEDPDFSPKAFAHKRQADFMVIPSNAIDWQNTRLPDLGILLLRLF